MVFNEGGSAGSTGGDAVNLRTRWHRLGVPTTASSLLGGPQAGHKVCPEGQRLGRDLLPFPTWPLTTLRLQVLRDAGLVALLLRDLHKVVVVLILVLRGCRLWTHPQTCEWTAQAETRTAPVLLLCTFSRLGFTVDRDGRIGGPLPSLNHTSCTRSSTGRP